jgi:hypothetical protein
MRSRMEAVRAARPSPVVRGPQLCVQFQHSRMFSANCSSGRAVTRVGTICGWPGWPITDVVKQGERIICDQCAIGSALCPFARDLRRAPAPFASQGRGPSSALDFPNLPATNRFGGTTQ